MNTASTPRNKMTGFAMRGGIEFPETVVHGTGSCGHELKGRPLWMVGKVNICFPCWETEVAEQKRILQNITPEAQEFYFLDYHKDVDFLAEPPQTEAEADAAECERIDGWLRAGAVYCDGGMEGSDTSIQSQLHDAGFGEDGRL